MRRYARIENDRVAEVVACDGPIGGRYHPALRWVEADASPGAEAGWRFVDGRFVPPEPAALATPPATPSIAELRERLAEIERELAALAG